VSEILLSWDLNQSFIDIVTPLLIGFVFGWGWGWFGVCVGFGLGLCWVWVGFVLGLGWVCVGFGVCCGGGKIRVRLALHSESLCRLYNPFCNPLCK